MPRRKPKPEPPPAEAPVVVRTAPSEFKTLRLGAGCLVEDGTDLDKTRADEPALLLRATVLTSEEWRLVAVDNGVWVFQRPLRPNRGLAATLSAE